MRLWGLGLRVPGLGSLGLEVSKALGFRILATLLGVPGVLADVWLLLLLLHRGPTADGQNPALPIIRNIP